MRKLYAPVLFLSLFAAACRSETDFGECIGVADEGDPKLVYEASVYNAVLGVIFFEMVFPPIIWLLDDFKCPTGVK